MNITYCTVCCNRLWQLQQTLKHNIKYTIKDEVEICILAYNDDNVLPYIIKEYQEYLEDGRLKVKNHRDNYKPLDGSSFACGYTKSISHQMGTGKVLFNLDADNFIDDRVHTQLLYLEDNYILKNIAILDGRSGRIGLHRELYNKAGGYRDVGRSDDGEFISRCLNIKGTKLLLTDLEIPPLPNKREIK